MAVEMTASSCGGSSGRSLVMVGGGSARCAYMTATSESFGKGTAPERHSYSTVPSA
jgi:hypothetical protein